MTATSVSGPSIASALSPEFKSAVRQQTSLLAPLERVCLSWFARNLPSWVKPDHLTVLGFAAMLAAGAFYALAKQWPPALLIVNVCLAINWFGDSLDGTLARTRNKQRPRYGFYVDHIIDAFGILAIICGLALSGYMTLTIALAVLVVYFMISIDVYLATYTIGTFKLSFYKFSPTELRILLAIGNVRALSHPTTHALGGHYLFFDVGAVVAMALMAIVLIISVTRNTITLYRAERV
jgi:phosphatidylglycerophosphate synthase